MTRSSYPFLPVTFLEFLLHKLYPALHLKFISSFIFKFFNLFGINFPIFNINNIKLLYLIVLILNSTFATFGTKQNNKSSKKYSPLLSNTK